MSTAPARPSSNLQDAFQLVARSDELVGDGPFARSVGGVDLVVVRHGGALRVFEGLCPHQGALLGEGELDGGELVCRNHRWRFDATTGQRRGGPQCLRACPSRVEDGALLADVSALGAAAAPARPAARAIKSLPGPRGLPLLGNAHQVDVTALHDELESWAREYGAPYRFRLGPRQVIAVTDPAIMTSVLRARPERFRRTSNLEKVFAEMRTHGVFSAEGEAWRPQRRLAMEALAHKNLKAFYATLKVVAGRLERRWAAAAAEGRTVDVQADLMRFTVDVTTSLAFGLDMNTLEQGDDVIQKKLELIFPKVAARLTIPIPYWRLIRLPSDRAVDRALADVTDFVRGLIAQARARAAQAATSADDDPANFLDAMVGARDQHGQPWSDEVLVGNAMTMLLAGEDTTANTLAWAIHELLDAPAEVAALRAELDAAGIAGPPGDVDQATRLTYAGAVASETLRVRPVAPLFFVECIGDEEIGGIECPAGTSVVLLARLPGLDATHFADPTSFRPSRWVEPVGAHDPAAIIPFGSGPRICPGRSLALLEMKVVLATLYSKFDVTRVGARDEVRELFAFTMPPVGLRVRFSPRA